MKNVMLDLETLGTKAGCSILSIGAVFFNPWTGETGERFYVNINVESCEKLGLTADPKTVQWWSEQSQEAKEGLKINQFEVSLAVMFFIQWFNKNKGEEVWCQGAGFDAPILEHIIEKLGYETPWKFWNVRDTRTVYSLFSFNPNSIKREGTYHNALDDSLHQVKCVYNAIKKGYNDSKSSKN